jgi:Domain of unknown function (DUF4145)
MTTKTVKGHCPNCIADRNADIVAEYEKKGSAEDDPTMWYTCNHEILRCLGCNEIYYRKEATHAEEYNVVRNVHTGETEWIYIPKITYRPSPSERRLPSWSAGLWTIDTVLDELMTETYAALNNDARILAAIGLRTIFDHVSEKLGVDPSLSFKAKLVALQQAGHIGASEGETLTVLTDAGSAAAHRGWKPSLPQLATLMMIGESFVYRTILLDGQAKKLKTHIPSKPKPNKPQ